MAITVVPRPLCLALSPHTQVTLSTYTLAHPVRLITTRTVRQEPDHANDLSSSRLRDGNKAGVGPAQCEVNGRFSFRPPCLSDLGEGPQKQPLR